MSDGKRQDLKRSKRSQDQGSRPNSAHASGRNTPDPHSSGQPIVDPHFGGQPTVSNKSNIFGKIFRRSKQADHPTSHSNGQSTLDRPSSDQLTPGPRTSGQSTPNQQRTADHYGGQPLSQATSGGHPGPYSSIQLTPKLRSGQRIPDPSSSDQGVQRTPDPVSAGQSNAASHSSRQAAFNLHFGDQPTRDLRSSEEPTPDTQGITGGDSNSQSIREPTSSVNRAPVSGQPINDGIYIITNVKHGTLVFLLDPNHRTPLQGHFRRKIPGELWHVEELFNQRYSIQSVSHKSLASSSSTPQVKDFVEGDSLVQPWRIQKHPEGNYTVSTTDGQNFWALLQENLETPVELYSAPADPRCRWTFTKLVDDAYAETIVTSEALDAPLNRLQGSNFDHSTTAKNMRDDFEKQREDSGRATKSGRDSAEDFRILDRLRPVDAAGYREDHGCMEGTRAALLDYLLDWSSKPSPLPNAANIYWLYGSPGLGKTTIANSLCDRLHGSKTLGGSFFCRRDDPVLREPRRVLPTLISKLAGMWGPYRKLIAHALREDPQLNRESKRGEVLFSLLQSVQKPAPHTLVLVVDALDECGDPDTRKSLLTCLLEACSHVS